MQINETQYQQIMEALQGGDCLKCLEARIMLTDLKEGRCAVRSFFRNASESQKLWVEWTNRAST